MTLVIGKTSYLNTPNLINNSYSSMDSANSPSWRVSNLVAGTLVNLGTGINTSDCNYNPFTKRFGFIRNNSGTITEISEADIVNSVATPTLIRVINIGGIAGLEDTEGLSDVVPNLLEGGYECWFSIENGGRRWVYNLPLTEAEMLSTSTISPLSRQRLQLDANASNGNDGTEGVGFSWVSQRIIAVTEGAVDVRKIYLADRPTDRDTDLDEAVDAGLTVTNPFDADVILSSTYDQSSVCFHEPTGHMLILSDVGKVVLQYDFSGTLISTLALPNHFQPEGICMHGDNMVVMGEADECAYFTYVAP